MSVALSDSSTIQVLRVQNAKCCAMYYLQWRIARHYLGNLVELVIRATNVSILLTEKMLLCFKYFIEMKCYVVFILNRQYVEYVFWMF
jgi:hypothetical protein